MGGRRITDEQHRQIIEQRLAGTPISTIARNVGVSEYAVRCHSANAVAQAGDNVVPPKDRCLPPQENGEEWAEIDGFDGRYLISSHGRVFSTRPSTHTPKILKPLGAKYTYDKVVLVSDRPRHYLIHQLVAEHFCDGRDESHDKIVHLDGNIKNNRADNLAWSEHAGDIVPWARHERMDGPQQIKAARAFYHYGASVYDIAKRFHVPSSLVKEWVSGEVRFSDAALFSLSGEEWREVEGYGGKYQVSSFGRVFSTGGQTRKGGLLKVYTAKNGYQSVSLSGNGRSGSTPLHRLVALHFCDGHDDVNDVVNHIDGNPSNNHADNLEWCTQSQNVRHAIDVLERNIGGGNMSDEARARLSEKKGTQGTVRNFTDDEVRSIREDRRSCRQLAKALGVNKSTIQRIRKRETYSYVE